MIKHTKLFFICLSLSIPALQAQDAIDSTMVNESLEWTGAQDRAPIEDGQDVPPYVRAIDINYDYIAPAKFTTRDVKDQQISYQQANVGLALVKLFGCVDEGAAITLGYTYENVHWNQNPYFDESSFNNITLGIGGFTKRICRWDWRGSISATFDTDHFGEGEYNLYNYLLWGRYEWDCCFLQDAGLHIGVVGRSGIEQNLALPIFGFDFKVGDCWKITFAYPVNMAAVYTINENWSISIVGKIWNTRHRVDKDEPLPRGIIDYRNAGAEVGLNYILDKYFTANVHVGSTLGNGNIKIANHNDTHESYKRFKASPYVGGALSLKF